MQRRCAFDHAECEGTIETGADYADASYGWIETPKRIAAKSWKPPVAPRLELDDIPF